MKKFLALFLALLTILSVSLVACGKDGDGTGESSSSDTTDNIWTGDPSGTTDPTGTTGGNSAVTTTPPSLEWVTSSSTVYVAYAGTCIIRGSASTSGEQVGIAKFGDSFTRVKYNDVWTAVTYNGSECYIMTELLSTSAGKVLYNDVTPVTVYIIAETALNLRWCVYSEATADSTVAVSADKGDSFTQTGLSQDGTWARLEAEVGGQKVSVYCQAKYINVDPNATLGGGEVTAPPLG